MKKIGVKTVRLLMRLASGDPVESMEAAKAIIASGNVSHSLLEEVASKKQFRTWSRIAAVYTLGFATDTSSPRTLMRILADEFEPGSLRSHAAEALGNRRYQRAQSLLRTLASSSAPRIMKLSCLYALSEITKARGN